MAFKKIADYQPLTDLQSQQFLANFMPKGRLFARVTDGISNLYKLIYCISDWIKQITSQLYSLFSNRQFTTIIELLPEWETSVGIPNQFQRLSTIAQRQMAIRQLVSKIPVINTQSYALGTVSINNLTGIVTVTLTTDLILTNQTTVTVTNCTNQDLNGTFNIISILSYNSFTYSIYSIGADGIMATNNGALIQTNTGSVIEVGSLTDSGNFAFNYSWPLNTTYENFVYNMTGFIIHIYFDPFGNTNDFPCTFPIVFGASYNQALLLFNILVVSAIPLTTAQVAQINFALNWVIPCWASWQIVGIIGS